MDQYRKSIIETYRYLNSTRDELFTHALNIAMAGELKEMGEAFDLGDTYAFEISQLKGTPDANLNELIHLYEHMENLINYLSTVNGINDEDPDE